MSNSRTAFEDKFYNKWFWRKNLLLAKLAPHRKNKELQLLMKDFEDLYSKKEIESDRAYIRYKKSSLGEGYQGFDRRTEMFILDGIVYGDWLGSGINAAEASDYDDYQNYTDLVVETANGRTAFCLDITTAKNKDVIIKKLSHSKGNLPPGFTKLKYYKLRGPLPRFVVGLNSSLIIEAEKALGLSSRTMRCQDFSKLDCRINEEITTELLLEILLEAELFKKTAKTEEEIAKLKRIEKHLWRTLILAVEKKGNPKKRTFGKRQNATLSEFGFYEASSPKNGAFKTIIHTVKQLI